MAVINMNDNSKRNISSIPFHQSNHQTDDKIVNENGDETMNEKYVTKDVFDAHIKRIDDKIDILPDRMNDKMKNLLLEEREYQRNQQKETRRFLWGTIGIGIASIVVSIVIAFVN